MSSQLPAALNCQPCCKQESANTCDACQQKLVNQEDGLANAACGPALLSVAEVYTATIFAKIWNADSAAG
jgi:hypothetical protein